MYIAEIPTYTKDKKLSHVSILLRHSYRENGKNKTRTIANITHEDPASIEAIRWALKNKAIIKELETLESGLIKRQQSKSIGAVYLVYTLLKQSGIVKALGTGWQAQLALYQIIARIIGRGSRLSAARLGENYAICEVLSIKEKFTEDDLYKNLAWLRNNQSQIENRLFKLRYKEKSKDLFLYDVTSSYMEGSHNELARYGYNRDKKRGKLQVVAGLLCDSEGYPVSVKVFEGNTLDYHTVSAEIKQVSSEFGCERVTFIGDRGMLKSKQIEELEANDFFYITAITKSQIQKMLKDGIIEMSFFDEEIREVVYDGVRYIMKRNPVRAEEIQRNREEKQRTIAKLLGKKNKYLSEHSKAKPETAMKEVNKKISSLKISSWLSSRLEGRIITIELDKKRLSEDSLLDGCYVIKSNVPQDISKEAVHGRYKELSKVEDAFRCSKTELLELRPWFVQQESSTRGHALVVMLSYIIIKMLKGYWKAIDATVKEGLKQLDTLCLEKVIIKNKMSYYEIIEPREMSKLLLKSANVTLPHKLPFINTNVSSRKKLKRK
jgi:transposase